MKGSPPGFIGRCVVPTDMELTRTPDELVCSACDERIEDTGYLPAVDRGDAYDPTPEAAVCGACGFNEVGYAGCAPELDDVVDPGPDDVLLHVRVTDDGVEPLSAKD